jgi:hypothetical protein
MGISGEIPHSLILISHWFLTRVCWQIDPIYSFFPSKIKETSITCGLYIL